MHAAMEELVVACPQYMLGNNSCSTISLTLMCFVLKNNISIVQLQHVNSLNHVLVKHTQPRPCHIDFLLFFFFVFFLLFFFFSSTRYFYSNKPSLHQRVMHYIVYIWQFWIKTLGAIFLMFFFLSFDVIDIVFLLNSAFCKSTRIPNTDD